MNHELLGLFVAAALVGLLLGLLLAYARVKAAPTPLNLQQQGAGVGAFDLNSFMQSYYLQPKPELIAHAIASLSSVGLAKVPNALPSVLGFFSEVFASNPAKMAEWQTAIATQDDTTRRVLVEAIALSTAEGHQRTAPPSAAANDMLWGAFFASGNSHYVLKLVDQLRYADERDDFNLFASGWSAMWSLASNSRTHKRVRETIEAARDKAPGRMRELMEEVLSKDPNEIGREVEAIVVAQRQAGKWK